MTLIANGQRLATRRSGAGDPLVLVHANLADMRSWEPVEPVLAEHFHVVNYSRRYAPPNLPIRPDADDPWEVQAEDLVALVEALDLGPVHLLGNSSGAFIALLAAARRPDLVRSLSLEEPPVASLFARSLPPSPLDMIKLLATDPGAFLAFARFGAGTIGPTVKAFKKGDDKAAMEAFGRGVMGSKAYERVPASRLRQMADNLPSHRAVMLGSGLPSFGPEEARALKVPTLLIRGDDATPFQRRINARLTELVPGARSVVINNASHFVHEDNPAAVATAVRDFVEEVVNSRKN